MFTGIVQTTGEVTALERSGDPLMSVSSTLDLASVAIGASIACNGVCLTVVRTEGHVFQVQMSPETVAVTTAKEWKVGTKLNLERALCLGDELGGHMVLGHVDGVAEVVDSVPDGETRRFRFSVPPTFARFIASKGSVAIDGVSLTVNEVDGDQFGVAIIPHTQKATCFGLYTKGSRVNFEVDVMARYVARLAERP